ncbi:mitochondrial genome maintenance protein [Ophiocordyceps camponoti-floridani]|uniref:Mitochondrial genome maintenance protein MGM101 n=1 Tax=Ophiocordyceps camponoti-floridani TaxID=2030778 RepID=A0A8H4VGR8_9HYPO|nr:mitochondrial genome maintenance protein [Ophiocordyceps camponoti-floridani]
MSVFRQTFATASRLRLGATACRSTSANQAAPAMLSTRLMRRALSSEASNPPPQYQPAVPPQWTTETEADAASAADVNWASSFHGVATKPVTEEQFQVLMRPLPEAEIEVKPDGVIYLPEIKYRRRLNEAFGPMGWGLIPKGDAVVGQSIVTREYALIVNGRFVSQAQGENPFFSPEQLPSAVEGCKSNALMRCCKDLGIGSELWDPQYVRHFRKNNMEEVWVEHVITKKKRTFWYRRGAVEVVYPHKIAVNSRSN